MTAMVTAYGPTDVFVELVESAEWHENALWEKKPQQYSADPSKIKSEVWWMPEGALDLGAIVDTTIMCNRLAEYRRTRFIKYPEGGFVKQHADKMDDAAFRLVFIPPKSAFRWEGGDLVVGSNSFNQHPSQWTVVRIDPGVPHSVMPVTRGTRYVVVTDVAMVARPTSYQTHDYDSESEDDIGFYSYFD